MDINWIDEIPGSVQGTPVNRLRLMGMQGYFPGSTTITRRSDTLTEIAQTSTEGVTGTAIEKNNDGSISITRQFISTNNQIITKITNITKNGDITTITEQVQ